MASTVTYYADIHDSLYGKPTQLTFLTRDEAVSWAADHQGVVTVVSVTADGVTVPGPWTTPQSYLDADNISVPGTIFVGRDAYDIAAPAYTEVPRTWGTRWRQALTQANSRLVRVVWLGDSTSIGPYVGQAMKNYTAKLRDALAAAGYPDGGSGYIDFNGTGVGGFGGPGGLNGPSTDAVMTGAWTNATDGVNNARFNPTVSGNNATITLFPRGTSIDIISRTDPTFGRYDRQIDGGSVVQVPQNLTAAVQSTPVTGLAAGYHSVKVTAAAGQCRFHGVRGRNAVGVIVDNFSQGGRAVTGSGNSFGTAAEGLGKTSIEATFDAIPTCDLCVLCIGVNDADGANTGTPQQMRDTLAVLHRRLRAVGGATGQPDLLVVIEHISGFQDAAVPYRYSWIADTLRSWARSMGAAIVDLWAFGRFSGEYANTQGWFVFGVPDVHPSDSGFVTLSAPITDLIV